MPDITGLPYLVDTVAAYLQGNGVTAAVILGWREDVQQVNEGDGTANRIVFQPGDTHGSAGELADPRQSGYGPRTVWPPPPEAGMNAQPTDDEVGRELNDWAERATVFIWAVDPTDTADDRRQYIAVRSLLAWARRAMQYAARAALNVGALEWVAAENIEKQYGRELQLSIVYHSPIFDLGLQRVHPGTVAPSGTFTT